MSRVLQGITAGFPIWVVLFGGLALLQPQWFTWFRGPWIVWGLAFIMLGMGLTLRLDDFRRVAKVPRPIALGLVGQFTIMPLLGFGLGKLFALPPSLAVGLVLVSCCPGGTASNVVAYLARSNVALSVSMTACSTMAAIVLTPALTAWLAGTLVEVDAWGLFESTVQVVVLPVSLGVGLATWAPTWTARVEPAAPVVSVALIVLIVASVLGANQAAVLDAGLRLLGAIWTLHGAGFALGWGLARTFGYEAQIRRTVSIEVGMQNSGLGAVLAQRHFSDPITAVPSAISAATHCIIGSALAAIWRRLPDGSERQEPISG